MEDKIPFYDIINKLFVGAVFSLLLFVTIGEKFPVLDYYSHYQAVIEGFGVVCSAIIVIAMYEIGFIINRCGSIFVGPILEKTKIWPKKEYKIDVSKIKKENETFNSMITELVLLRSHILMYTILTVIALISQKWLNLVIYIVFIVIFILSGKKHNIKINKIRDEYNERNNHDH